LQEGQIHLSSAGVIAPTASLFLSWGINNLSSAGVIAAAIAEDSEVEGAAASCPLLLRVVVAAFVCGEIKFGISMLLLVRCLLVLENCEVKSDENMSKVEQSKGKVSDLCGLFIDKKRDMGAGGFTLSLAHESHITYYLLFFLK
jgi:hypothetical protein